MDLELDWVLGKMPRKVRGVGAGMSFWCGSSQTSPYLPVLWHCVPSLPWLLTLPCCHLLQEFFLQREPPALQPLALPPGLTVRQALERVLRLPAVASKRYLTNKVLPAQPLSPLSSLRLCPWPPALRVCSGSRSRVKTASHPV